MEKIFVNALAYSRVLKSLMIAVLIFVVIMDIALTALVMKVIGYATPEERTKLITLTVLLLLSSAIGFLLFYFIRRSIREQWIKTGEQGIAYGSWAKKVSASWDDVTGVSIVSRGRYGQALRAKGLRIDTNSGKIYALPTFVDKSLPIPQLKMSLSSQKLLYPDGTLKKVDVKTCDVYMELQNYIPELLV